MTHGTHKYVSNILSTNVFNRERIGDRLPHITQIDKCQNSERLIKQILQAIGFVAIYSKLFIY